MRLSVEGAAARLEGPLLFLRRTLDVGLYDAVEVDGGDGQARLGRVAAIDDDLMTIEVLESTSGLGLAHTVVRFLGEPLTFGLSPGILGRVFNGVGQVIDGGPPIAVRTRARIEGLPINPQARAGPRDFIETGVTTLDLMNSLVRGQKLPIFSGGGLPHDRLAVEIARHARLRRQRGVFPAQPGAERRARAHCTLPQPRERFVDPAAAHAPLRAHRRRVPRVRRRQARAGDPHRHDELRRGAARGELVQGRDPEPQGIPGLSLLGPRVAVRARGRHPRAAGHAHAVVDPHHAGRRHRPSDP